MDFKSIIDTTRNYNFHSHTQFCDGRAPMYEMASSAVRHGMEHYGFSPHSPIPIASPCNMSRDDMAAYLAEADRIKNAPELASCRFYTALEVDYLGPEWGPSNRYFKELPLDYLIGSVHFIPSQSGELVDIDGHFDSFSRRMKEFFRNDIEYVVETFYAQSTAMIEAGGFDILGHFDKVSQNASYYAPGIEDSEHYRQLVGKLVDLIVEKNLVVELNTKARVDLGRFFPSERYLSRLVRDGVTIVVNSDAHHPDRILASREEAFRLLDSLALCVQ
ncbi:MAG: histidinol-phosphatase [Muribaculaceae bacterium]|nr:histidinol-phosphatase [Muribaculaceae bacterium]